MISSAAVSTHAGEQRPEEVLSLCDVEVETVRRAAELRGLDFDPSKRSYTQAELRRYGVVREGYNRKELRAQGVHPQVVSSLDPATEVKMRQLRISAPYGEGIEKYELPIDMLPLRVAKTVFAPGTQVHSHVHPEHSEEAPGGGLRIVVSGSINFGGKTYRVGDWFFIPNGTPYEFSTDPAVETIVFYKYAFFGVEFGNRFSHPHACSDRGDESRSCDSPRLRVVGDEE